MPFRHARRPVRAITFFVLAVALTVSAGTAWAQQRQGQAAAGKGWDFMLGGGAGYAPKYEGGRRMKVIPVPFVDISWNDTLFIGGNGLGARYAVNEMVTVGMSVGLAEGRKEKDGPRLRGMGEIKDAARVKAFTNLSFGNFAIDASLSQDTGGSRGLLGELGASYTVPIGSTVTVAFGASTTYASERHMREFFGVSAAQSRRSGLKAYSPEAGLKRAEGTVTVNWRLTDHLGLLATGGVGTLMGDAKDSPVVERKIQPFGAVGLTYRF